MSALTEVPTQPGRPPDGLEETTAGERPGARGLEGRWLVAAVVVVGAMVTVGLVLRFWTRSALWLDEALTVNIARLPLKDLHGALRRDGAPPLYYVLLHFWMQLFGTSDLAVRSLSGALSVVTLPVVWLAGRRLGGRSVAWAALLLVATAPFAVYYATEARMYALVMFLTAVGFVTLERARRVRSPLALAAVAVTTAALLYSQYWALYLVATVALWLLFGAWRSRGEERRRALAALGAVAVGVLAFVPWVPTFLFQAAHTGTPWAAPPNFSAVISAVTGFTENQATLVSTASNQGRLLAVFYFSLGALALFGAARDRWHIELDLRTRPRARGVAFVVVGTLFFAIGGGIASGSAFSPRYASVVFVPLVVLVAFGAITFSSPKLRAVVLALAAGAGLITAAQNVTTQRTQAVTVSKVIRHEARPGDVVAFCPDQLGPATDRLLPQRRYHLITYPRGTSPAFVNWVDYKSVAEHSHPVDFAERLLAEAGPRHAIFVVWAPGYQGFGTKCEQMLEQLALTPGEVQRTWINQQPSTYYEPISLVEFSKAA